MDNQRRQEIDKDMAEIKAYLKGGVFISDLEFKDKVITYRSTLDPLKKSALKAELRLEAKRRLGLANSEADIQVHHDEITERIIQDAGYKMLLEEIAT